MPAKHPEHKTRQGVDRAGRTPLHYAAAESDVERVRQLLASGIDPGTPDDQRWTPLHFAAYANAADVARILLDAGAPVDPRDAHGNTPLFKAVFSSQGNGNLIKLLRSHGADPCAENKHGVSPLKLAHAIANYDVRQFFGDLSEQSDS